VYPVPHHKAFFRLKTTDKGMDIRRGYGEEKQEKMKNQSH